MATVDDAVRLVRQAVIQDSKRNYVEAARCYKDAISCFYELGKRRENGRIAEFINNRLQQYQQRLRVIERHLLNQTDLTKLIRDLEVGGIGDDSSLSSSSTTTRQLYKNPLLVSALDSLRRGRKADERRNYQLALSCYQNGLSKLLDLVNAGSLTPRQEEKARAKWLMYQDRVATIQSNLETGDRVRDRSVDVSNLSLSSACDSPVPYTDTDTCLEMQEVQSCCSRLGSHQSLNQSYEAPTTTERRTDGHTEEERSLDKTHETLRASLPQLYHSNLFNQGVGRSTHSLYPNCEIRRPPTSMSEWSEPRPVPLANLSKEMSLSVDSCCSRPSSPQLTADRSIGDSLYFVPPSRRSKENLCSSIEKLGSEEYSEDTVDTLESELVNLSADDDKIDDASSDSGYSDPSPDGRDNKSPESNADRKSPFSERGSPDSGSATELTGADLKLSRAAFSPEPETHYVVPNVIIQNNQLEGAFSTNSINKVGGSKSSLKPAASRSSLAEAMSSSVFPRSFSRQRSVFQNPEKDILTGAASRDNIAVLGGGGGSKDVVTARDTVDTAPLLQNREVYGVRREAETAIPRRAEARRRDEEQRDGCFYLVAALDFCWCL